MKRGLIYNEEESEERMRVIAQNGNTGLHYDRYVATASDTSLDTISSNPINLTNVQTGTNTGDQVSTDMIDAFAYSVSNEGGSGTTHGHYDYLLPSKSDPLDGCTTYKPRDFDKQQLPDARKHQIISFIKSGIRILGYVLLPFDIVAATVVLVISEVVGILEELV